VTWLGIASHLSACLASHRAKAARELIDVQRECTLAEGTSAYRVVAPKLQYECDVTTRFA